MKINRYLLLAFAAAFWSLNFIIGKLLAGAVPPIAINFLRWFIAVLVFLPQTWLDIKENLPSYLSRGRIYLLLLLVLTGYCVNGIATYLAVNYTTAINASLIQTFNPIIFTLLAFLLYRERIDNIQVVGILASMTGVFWIIFRGEWSRLLQLNVNPGDIIMLLAVISWALYSLVYREKAGIFPPKPLFTMLLLGGLLMNFILFFIDSMINGLGWVQELNSSHVLGLLALNIFPTLLSFVCWNAAIVKVSAGEAAVFLNLIPVFVTIISVLFLDETLLLSSLVGGGFVIVGVLLVTNSKQIRLHLPFGR